MFTALDTYDSWYDNYAERHISIFYKGSFVNSAFCSLVRNREEVERPEHIQSCVYLKQFYIFTQDTISSITN